MEIFKLFGSILVDSDEANASIAKTGDKAEGLGTKLGKGIKTAAKFGAALVAGALVAGAGMIALGVKLGNTADEILDLNSITGMSTDSIQEWRKVSEVAGVGADSMTNASMKLTKSLDAMSSGTGKGAESLEKLGFSFKEIEGMSADERMNALTEALAGVDDKTERARIGTDLFGGSWKEIAPVVDLGAEAMQKAKDSANIISEDNLKKANDFRIKVEDMKEKLSFFVTEITIMFLPALQLMMDWFSGKMPLIQSIFKVALDIVGEALKSVGGFIKNEVVPAFQSLYDWIQPKIPAIKDTISKAFEAIEKVFGKVKDAVKFLYDNMNILIPIVLGLTGAIVAQMIINSLVGAYKAWQAATKTQTALQWLLNIALNANPLGLVALAIGAVIAIGILLWRNWDLIKAKTLELWSVITSKFTDIKNSVVTKVNELKVQAVSKFSELVVSARSKFEEVQSAIMNPINSAKDKVKGAIDTIKGFFSSLVLKLPDIKVPSFSLSNWSINPLDWVKNMPSIKINWNAKGGIFDKPTIFNTSAGLQGVGEVPGESEAIIPLNSKVLGGIGRGVGETMEGHQTNNYYVTIDAKNVKDFNDIVVLANGLKQTVNAY